MRQGFPPARRGMVIGLLGGSFDPAHDGHAHITREAIKRMGLDQARKVMRHPRVQITALTYDLVISKTSKSSTKTLSK